MFSTQFYLKFAKMNITKFLFFLTFSTGFSVFAQDLSDVYRWSFIGIGGTSRAAGLANAVTALGGDAMNATINPAGLGMYRKGDLMFTLSTRIGSTSSKYIETTSNAGRFNLAVSNFAYVLPFNPDNRGGEGWQGAVISFHLNQYNNFARRTNFSGYNAVNSICDFFAQEGNRTGVSQNTYFGRLGYNTYLTDSAGTSALLPAIAGGKVNQSFSRFEAGRMGEYGMALAGNYAEKLFLGVGVNIVRGVYNREIEYSEETENASYNYILSNNGGNDGYGLFRSTYNDVLKTKTTGINVKFGILYKPNNTLRIGLQFQTPTLLGMEDTYTTEVTADFSKKIGNPTFAAPSYTDSLRGKYEYNIVTPTRLTAGAAFFVAKRGFVTGEIEYVNYTRAVINDRNNSFKEVNKQIARNFQAVINFKVAGELRLDDHFQVRTGFAALTTPLNIKAREYTANNQVTRVLGWQPNVTGGFGYRDEDFYVDLTGIWNLSEEKYYPYLVNDTPSPLAINTFRTVQIFFTIGFRF